MPLTVEYLARLRDAMGTAQEVVEPPAGTDTVAELIDWLASRDARGNALRGEGIHVACDDRVVDRAAPLDGVRTVTLFPPVTGG